MRVAGAHDVISAQVVIFAREETIDLARRNTERAQQDGHRRSKVFAVAGSSLKEQMSERIVSGFTGQIQRVRVASPQEGLDGARLFQGRLQALRSRPGMFRD